MILKCKCLEGKTKSLCCFYFAVLVVFLSHCRRCKSCNALDTIDSFHQWRCFFFPTELKTKSEQITMHMIVIISPPEYMFVIQRWHECVYPFLIGDTVFRIYKRIKGFVSIYLQFAYTSHDTNGTVIESSARPHARKHTQTKTTALLPRFPCSAPIRQIDKSNERYSSHQLNYIDKTRNNGKKSYQGNIRTPETAQISI